MAITSASYTIMDYTDGITLLGSLDTNHVRTVLYDTTNQTYNPSWATTALVITPRLTKAGSVTDLISTLTSSAWYRRVSGGAWVAVVSGSNGETIAPATKILTVNQNKMTGNIWQIEYKFVAVYLDPILNVSLHYGMEIAFSRVANGTSFVVARAFTPGGNQFKNGLPASLLINAELIRGTTADTTSLTYIWEKSVNGTVWTVTPGSTSSLSITPAMVDSFAVFRCKVKDTDAASDTYNTTFITEGITILDVSDPYQMEIRSSAGQFFKNNTGSTVLTAHVYLDGEEIDIAGTDFTYTWRMNDKDGNPVTTILTTTFPKAGKTLAVTHDMTSVKGEFYCTLD